MLTTVHAAMDKLGLADGFGEREVQRAFHERAFTTHPDHQLIEAPEEFQSLCEARDVALASLTVPTTQLARQGGLEELVSQQTRQIETTLKAHNYHRQAERAVRQLVSHHASQLSKKQRELSFIWVLGAGLTFVIGFARLAATESVAANLALLSVTVVCGVVSAVVAGIAAILRTKIKTLEVTLSDIAESISDRTTCAELLYEIALSGNGGMSWSRDLMREAVAHWLQNLDAPPRPLLTGGISRDDELMASLAATVGEIDFVRLLLAKGLELGLLDETEDRRNGKPAFVYRFVGVEQSHLTWQAMNASKVGFE